MREEIKNLIDIILPIPISAFKGHKAFIKARKYEKEQKYGEACYFYAISLMDNSILDEDNIKARIGNIWAEHGPFNYANKPNDQIHLKVIRTILEIVNKYQLRPNNSL